MAQQESQTSFNIHKSEPIPTGLPKNINSGNFLYASSPITTTLIMESASSSSSPSSSPSSSSPSSPALFAPLPLSLSSSSSSSSSSLTSPAAVVSSLSTIPDLKIYVNNNLVTENQMAKESQNPQAPPLPRIRKRDKLFRRLSSTRFL